MPDQTAGDDELTVEELAVDDAGDAAAILAGAEEAAGGELVDEAERRRLVAFAAPAHERAPRWQPFLAHRGDEAVGYAGLVLPVAAGGIAVGDVALVPGRHDRRPALTALLGQLVTAAEDGGAGHLSAWFRRGTETELAAAAEAGLPTERRLAVLGRSLPVGRDGPPPPLPAGVTIRAFRDGDDTEVVRVLADAYAGTPDAGWDVEAFRTRRSWEWFRPEDLLVAQTADGRLLGLHWLKRRDPTTGEVHNLAVHPDGQGTGLGAALLHAGFDHLADVGCREVLLWVDRANERAVRLYTSQGMTTRWEDVALGRSLAGQAERP